MVRSHTKKVMRELLNKLLPAVSITAALTFMVAPLLHVSAAQLPGRSLTVGNSKAVAITSHKFTFTMPSVQTVGSIKFEYCNNPLESIACVTPTGINASAAILAVQTSMTGFSILSSASGNIALTRVAAASPIGSVSYTFTNVVNPSVAGAYFVRMNTYASTDTTGVANNFGSVVGNVVSGVSISTEVPPILNFCVGQAIPTDCASSIGSFVQFGELSDQGTALGSSQMIAQTNADFGYVISMTGTTMTSGNNVIPALTIPTTSSIGVSQFGINLRNNTNPSVGSNVSGSGIGHPLSNYDQQNKFMFVNGDTIATSVNETDFNKYTVSYVTNVSSSQAPGVYNTTITYICVATF